MRIDVLTIFPEMVEAPLRASLLGKALEEGLLEVVVTDIRDFATDKHHSVDDAPYGGGPGMVMKCEPIFGAVKSLREKNSLERVILLTPKGRRLTQAIVKELAQADDFVLICGRYEGVDERVMDNVCSDAISVGDYVLSGGELPALTIVEAVSRMIPGVIGDWESVESDSFYAGRLGAPLYTRPASVEDLEVPTVLLNGHHSEIRRWRLKEALRQTLRVRPELLQNCSVEEKALLDEIEREQARDNSEAGKNTRQEAQKGE